MAVIPQNMKSVTRVKVNGVDLTTVHNLVMRIQQGKTILFEIPMTVIDSDYAYLPLTRDQAVQLAAKGATFQVLLEDRNGMPNRSKVKQMAIDLVIGGAYGS